MTTAAFCAGVIWGACLTLLLVLWKCTVFIKHPYIFTCPEEGCYFKVSANTDPVVVINMGERHLQLHREGRIDYE